MRVRDQDEPGQFKPESALQVIGLRKSYLGDNHSRVGAVNDVTFELQEGEFYTLLGPSGCGKTTTLRCVAGLERPDSGQISVAGTVVAGDGQFLAPYRRDIGMVFQSYAIWPHMTVFANVSFPLTIGRQRLSKAVIRRRVEESLATVALDGLEDRMATQLSGGQQQRLALARALIRRPKLLLLDEPLSNLDAKLRERLRAEVRNLQRTVGVTTLYVTHDQTEALSMSSRIAVLNEGRMVQEGKPRAIYQNPATPFVADFVGSSDFLKAQVVGSGQLKTDLGSTIVHAACPAGVSTSDEVTLAIRRENVEVYPIHQSPPGNAVNLFDARVVETVFVGESLDVWLQVGAARLAARLHPRFRVAAGDAVRVHLQPESCVVLSDEHGIASTTST